MCTNEGLGQGPLNGTCGTEAQEGGRHPLRGTRELQRLSERRPVTHTNHTQKKGGAEAKACVLERGREGRRPNLLPSAPPEALCPDDGGFSKP